MAIRIVSWHGNAMLRGPGRRAWREFTNGLQTLRASDRAKAWKSRVYRKWPVHNEVMRGSPTACVALAAALACLRCIECDGFGVPGEPSQQLRLSPEPAPAMLQQMTPEQREAFRNAGTPEERQPRSGGAFAGAAARVLQGSRRSSAS